MSGPPLPPQPSSGDSDPWPGHRRSRDRQEDEWEGDDGRVVGRFR